MELYAIRVDQGGGGAQDGEQSIALGGAELLLGQASGGKNTEIDGQNRETTVQIGPQDGQRDQQPHDASVAPAVILDQAHGNAKDEEGKQVRAGQKVNRSRPKPDQNQRQSDQGRGPARERVPEP